MSFKEQLIAKVHQDLHRLERKSRGPETWLGMLLYGGTLGLLFVVPIILGAYFGRWLDGLLTGYSVRWTLSLILLGTGLGAYNVWYFLREKL